MQRDKAGCLEKQPEILRGSTSFNSAKSQSHFFKSFISAGAKTFKVIKAARLFPKFLILSLPSLQLQTTLNNNNDSARHLDSRFLRIL